MLKFPGPHKKTKNLPILDGSEGFFTYLYAKIMEFIFPIPWFLWLAASRSQNRDVDNFYEKHIGYLMQIITTLLFIINMIEL